MIYELDNGDVIDVKIDKNKFHNKREALVTTYGSYKGFSFFLGEVEKGIVWV